MSDPATQPEQPPKRRRARYADNGKTNLQAQFDAQKLAFGPLMFQAARVLRETGASMELLSFEERVRLISRGDRIVRGTRFMLDADRLFPR